jgi:hypothetical protein
VWHFWNTVVYELREKDGTGETGGHEKMKRAPAALCWKIMPPRSFDAAGVDKSATVARNARKIIGRRLTKSSMWGRNNA